MNCIVTAGPTCEPLDEVRRLTNFSTGQLGTELAVFLAERGHPVTLLRGEGATFRSAHPGKTQRFASTADLRAKFQALRGSEIGAVFHAAAVSDFGFGKVWSRSEKGELTEIKSGKFSTRAGTLLVELVPTPKVIAELREWFPTAKLVGWKYEVEGARDDVIRLATRQIADCKTDRAVANGPAYGPGFGLVAADGTHQHLAGKPDLFDALEKLLRV